MVETSNLEDAYLKTTSVPDVTAAASELQVYFEDSLISAPNGTVSWENARNDLHLRNGGVGSELSEDYTVIGSPTENDVDGHLLGEDELIVVPFPQAPDGGWGWMVVLGSFIIHVIADGITYSFGVLTPVYISHFGVSRETVGWLASIMVGLTLGTGPIASLLSLRFGYRAVTITGAILSSVGFMMPYFYDSLPFLFFSAAVLTGTGFGLMYLPAIVTVGIYFEERRSLAIGIAVCGSGVGTFVFSPLIEFLVDTYTWRGAMLIAGALILNCVVCGLIFLPLSPSKTSTNTHNKNQSVDKHAQDILAQDFLNRSVLMIDNISHPQGPHFFHRVRSASMHDHRPQDAVLTKSMPDIRGHMVKNVPDKPNHHLLSLQLSHPHLLVSSVMSSLDLRSIDGVRRATSAEPPTKCRTCLDMCRSVLHGLFDTSLLKDPVFNLFAWSNFFTSLGFNAPYLYVTDRALLLGVESNYASYLIAAIGIGNTVGRLVFGALSSRECIDRLLLYNISLVLCGACTMLSSFCTTYPLMIVYTTGFGVLSGVYVTLTSVVLVDLLGVHKLNNSFGLILLFQGVAVLVGPPLAGWVYDTTGSYDASFWVCGGLIGFSGLMLFPIPCIQRRIKAAQTQSTQDNV